MEGLTKCKQCGRLFLRTEADELCSQCTDKGNSLLHEIKAFLDQHRDSSLEQISQNFDIAVEEILRFFKEGKLELKGELTGILRCEHCEQGIASGRYCEACAAKMSLSLKRAFDFAEDIQDESSKVKPRYHINLPKKK